LTTGIQPEVKPDVEGVHGAEQAHYREARLWIQPPTIGIAGTHDADVQRQPDERRAGRVLPLYA
jgi:hypothetical protein